MMTMKLVIPGTLPSLNEMINASKRSKYAYVAMKDQAINKIGWTFRTTMPGNVSQGLSDYTFTWYCPNMRKDKDNIIGGQKFVFDALQEIGFITNDGWKQIRNIEHRFEVDKKQPRLEVEIREVSA
jgi:Holliday junction resolvase RusA-like endonuclease